MSDPFEQFDAEFEKEWLVGRSDVIYQELHARFRDLTQRRTARRVQDILDAQEAGSFGGEDASIRVSAAQIQTMAENALLAVAVYIANHEPPPSQ
jgi:hypothetical protein